MTTARLLPVIAEGVQLTHSIAGDVLKVSMAGTVEMRDPGELLNPFWNALDAEASRLGIQRVEVDLKPVSFMNSSGILTLVRWVTKLKSRGAGAYRIDFRYDKNVTWQRTNVPMLGKLAPGAVTASPTD